jgi:BASS family bile acid:Na+ symporter
MEIFNISMIDLMINVVLAVIMFGLGISLTINDFKVILNAPKSFFIGLGSQMIALPLIAFLMTLPSNLPDVYKVGIMILAACPGGTTSGLVTYLFRGNVALSITLTIINSLLAIFTIPIIVNFSLHFYLHQKVSISLPLIDTVIHIFIITILPAITGLYLKRNYPEFSAFSQKYLKYLLIILLAAVYSVKFFADIDTGGSGITRVEVFQILPYAIVFNLLSFVFSIGFGRLTKLNIRDTLTIAVEVSLQNTTLALLIGGTMLQNQDLIKPALIYAMFSFWISVILGIMTISLYKKKLEFKF